ncbi:MAG: FecR domain-containing protein, partial [Bacteroidota bacterium]
MTEKEIKRLLRDYLKGTISAYDEKRLEEFDAKKAFAITPFGPVPLYFSCCENLGCGTLAWRQRKRVLRLGFRVAASVALLLGMGYAIVQFNKTEVPVTVSIVERSTEWGQKSTLELPDGTMVKLNSGSTLRFPETFSEDFREVELSGEAFFDVTQNPDKPFLIKSGNLRTIV